MKETFQHLKEKKKRRIIDACISEFAEMGYDLSSTYRIIKKAGISKGGLYEYISTKEELFLFTVEYAYQALYEHIEQAIREETPLPPGDLLDRINLASEKAISFYVANPDYVRLIVRTHHIQDSLLSDKVRRIFRSHFNHLFGDADTSRVFCDREKMVDLVTWILQKTRYDFLLELHKGGDFETIRKNYLSNWRFYLGVLRTGLYSAPGPEEPAP